MSGSTKQPVKKVRAYWWPPTLITRQALSILYVSVLTRWRRTPQWFLNYGFKCLPGAAGSLGMGCIGFPAHPVWEMTAQCNLHCVHCHASGGPPAETELSTQEGKRLLDQLANVREFRMMAFTGGEPLVRSDLFELLAYSKDLGFKNTLATNATLVDDYVASRLRRHGVVVAAVSLDGFDAETHDLVRGTPGAFKAAVRGMRALRKAGIVLQVNITAMEYNMNQIQQMMRFVEDLGTGILLMYQLVPVGRGRRIQEKALDVKANETLIRFMVEAQKTTAAVIEPVAGPQYWPFLLQNAGVTGGFRLRLAEMVFHGCSAGRGFVYIKPDGEVWPCPFIEISCGNIREKSFSTIWSGSSVFKNLRERESLLKGKCGRCTYRRLCGGCRGRAWATTQDYMDEDTSCFIHF